jgi:hypothetical protein
LCLHRRVKPSEISASIPLCASATIPTRIGRYK